MQYFKLPTVTGSKVPDPKVPSLSRPSTGEEIPVAKESFSTILKEKDKESTMETLPTSLHSEIPRRAPTSTFIMPGVVPQKATPSKVSPPVAKPTKERSNPLENPKWTGRSWCQSCKNWVPEDKMRYLVHLHEKNAKTHKWVDVDHLVQIKPDPSMLDPETQAYLGVRKCEYCIEGDLFPDEIADLGYGVRDEHHMDFPCIYCFSYNTYEPDNKKDARHFFCTECGEDFYI